MQEQQIKEKIKERYSKIALTGNSDCCCVPAECCNNDYSPSKSTKLIGYDNKDMESIHKSSILGVGCGAPTEFADLNQGETVVDLGSGAGIDVFLAANRVGELGKVIGIDMTDEMLDRAQKNAKDSRYANVEFRKGDIERRIPIKDNIADLVISNCVINLTVDKTAAFKEIYRILKNDGGRMIISDLVTDKEIAKESVNADNWCSCIDGALTKEHYLVSIRKAGFNNVEILEEKTYMGEQGNDDDKGRKISSIVVKAVKD